MNTKNRFHFQTTFANARFARHTFNSIQRLQTQHLHGSIKVKACLLSRLLSIKGPTYSEYFYLEVYLACQEETLQVLHHRLKPKHCLKFLHLVKTQIVYPYFTPLSCLCFGKSLNYGLCGIWICFSTKHPQGPLPWSWFSVLVSFILICANSGF